MDLEQVRRLVAQGENQNVEFKRKIQFPEKILKEFVAFANSSGGYLLIGVDDDKSFAGIKDAFEEHEVLVKYLIERVRPSLDYQFEIISLNRKRKVLLYHIPESPNKPHFLNPSMHAKLGQAYFRFEDKSIQASPELLKILRLRKKYKKGFVLKYGEVEKSIMKHMTDVNSLTIKDLVALSQNPRNTVANALVNLVLSNVVGIRPSDEGDKFFHKV